MFKSIYRTHLGEITFPKYSGTRITMMPVLVSRDVFMGYGDKHGK